METTNPDHAFSIRRLERLLQASRLLNSTLEIRELAEIVLQIIRDEVTVDRCTLFVLDRETHTLRSFLALGTDKFEVALRIGEGLAGTVAATGEPLDVPDAYADPRFRRDVDIAMRYRTKDVLCLPVYNCHQNLVGVLQL